MAVRLALFDQPLRAMRRRAAAIKPSAKGGQDRNHVRDQIVKASVTRACSRRWPMTASARPCAPAPITRDSNGWTVRAVGPRIHPGRHRPLGARRERRPSCLWPARLRPVNRQQHCSADVHGMLFDGFRNGKAAHDAPISPGSHSTGSVNGSLQARTPPAMLTTSYPRWLNWKAATELRRPLRQYAT